MDERSTPLLQVSHVVQEFAARGPANARQGTVHALTDVSLDVLEGEVVGVVGETGSGKTTLARSVLAAPKPKSGEILFQGADLMRMSRRELRQARRGIQMIFQDPTGSLNATMRVIDIVAEPLIAYRLGDRRERRSRAGEMLELVGLDPATYGERRPRELSGGQCQRVAIARALTLSPALLVCDEAVSSLDVLIQAQVLNLFEDLRAELGLSYVFIAHDLALVKQISDRVAVMYLGQLAEVGPAEEVYRRPLHPYTAALLSSIPTTDLDAPQLLHGDASDGEPPSPLDPPSGCRFRTRCPFAQDRCAAEQPVLRARTPGHAVACHFPLSGEPRPEEAVPTSHIG